MKFAIIETGGKQYKVAEGDLVQIEKIDDITKEGGAVEFDDVLLVAADSDTLLGADCTGKKVKGILEQTGKGKKISVIKFKAKSDYRRKYGHRQPFWKVRIQSIS